MWFTTSVRRRSVVSSVSSEMSWLLVLLFLAVLDALPVDVACVRLADIYWNSSNPMFRIDNTDHIIDVNQNNEKYEYDQVNIICPGYPPGTHEDDSEKYIIYNVSKEEYDMCTITGPSPRIIAVCDKPHRVMYFTITFRPFTPQPGGLEFRPGQDYYFISTSSKENFFNRIGGRCLTHNMRVVFKVCCNTPAKISTPWITSTSTTYYDNRVNGNALSTPNATTLSPMMSNTVRPRIIFPGPTFGPATPKYPTVIPRVYGGGGGSGYQSPTTLPDFKSSSMDGTGNGRGVKPGGSSSSVSSGGKKATGESKDKQHPNETGMKIEELVRNGAISSRTSHRWWSRSGLMAAILCPLLAVTLVRFAGR